MRRVGERQQITFQNDFDVSMHDTSNIELLMQ